MDIVKITPAYLIDEPLLTVIIPFKYNRQRPDVLEKIAYVKLDETLPENVTFLLVDDNSELEFQDKIKETCKSLDITYMRLEERGGLFSIARARNYGAMYSLSPYIMFMDVDLIVYNGFYQDVLDEIKLNDLENNTPDFLGFGVIYLSQKGTKKFLNANPEIRKKQFIHYLLENREDLIEKFSTGTSVQVFNREYYLARGGNSEQFMGWGFEDIEFTLRLAHKSKQFPLPRTFMQDYKNCKDIVEYKGFKSISRLYGDISFAKGITLFHAWHEVDHDSNYIKQKFNNRILFNQLVKDYIENASEPEPMPDISAGNTLLFTLTHPAIYNREIIPRYGKVFYEDENRFAEIKALADYLNEHAISRVILQNPYSNEIRLQIYKYLRAHNIKYYVVERGALPDSIFFDENGFNADSKSYHAQNWDFEISDQKRQATLSYIADEINNDSTLESQSSRISRRKLTKELKINPDKKILFVPLQTYSDTVITYFCGQHVKTFEEFLQLVEEVAIKLPENWVLIYKKHPLSKESKRFHNAICADDYNIKDLLNICDCILLINSGVGVLSMLWNKPVLYTGEIFYAHEAINKRVKNASEVINALEKLFVPDQEKIIRFLSFLINDFYCFGTSETKVVEWSNESNMTITTNIDFYKINNIGKTKYIYNIDRGVKINFKSILFDRYRFDLEYITRFGDKRAFIIRRPTAKTKTDKKALRQRRLGKFKRNPYQFFSDSRFFFLRPLRYFFK